MKKVLLAYVPVLHEGYRQFFVRYPLVNILHLFGEALIEKFDPLRKDIRALKPHLVKKAIEGWGIFKGIHIADESSLELLNQSRACIVMPDEDVSHEVARQYLTDCRVEFFRAFLRWDSKRSLAQVEVPCDEVIQADEFVTSVMNLALKEAQKSHNWWRQVGAVLIKDSEVLFTAFNQFTPSANHVFAFGDPRANFKKGLHFELSPEDHAEATIVAEAARRKDISLEGTDLYVTTFPCPPCARAVSRSGIRRLFFLEGYSVFDGAYMLRSRGVKIIRVQM